MKLIYQYRVLCRIFDDARPQLVLRSTNAGPDFVIPDTAGHTQPGAEFEIIIEKKDDLHHKSLRQD